MEKGAYEVLLVWRLIKIHLIKRCENDPMMIRYFMIFVPNVSLCQLCKPIFGSKVKVDNILGQQWVKDMMLFYGFYFKISPYVISVNQFLAQQAMAGWLVKHIHHYHKAIGPTIDQDYIGFLISIRVTNEKH